MKLFVLQIFIVFAFIGCKTKKSTSTATPCVENTNESCVCIDMYDPVCGCNNKTYSNSCYAECSGVTYVKGACKENKK